MIRVIPLNREWLIDDRCTSRGTIVEGNMLCILHISSANRKSRGYEKEEDKNNMARVFVRDVHEV